MLEIDGSQGEGGGQILRTALALSVITRQAFCLKNIRAGRAKPGLRQQHLTCVLAAQQVGAAELAGASLGSQELIFEPQGLSGGNYTFQQPGAGSTMLVLQTVLPMLLQAEQPSVLHLGGGTHNPMAPPFDFIAESFAPCLRQMGAHLQLDLQQAGFFPGGGGRCRVEISPAQLQPLMLEPGPDTARCCSRILLANLPLEIAERESQALAQSRWRDPKLQQPKAQGPGNLVLLSTELAGVCSLHVGFGQRGLRAEKLVKNLLAAAEHHLRSTYPVEEHLADQLLLPMALAGSGSFYTSTLSEHTRTNAAIIERFLPVQISQQATDKGWKITVSS